MDSMKTEYRMTAKQVIGEILFIMLVLAVVVVALATLG